MSYSQQFNSNKTLYPKIKQILMNIPEEYIFSNKHNNKIKHPLAIYNVGFESVIESINLLYDICHEENTDEKELIRLIENLIAKISSFYDNIFLILKSLSKPPQNEYDCKKAIDWLKSNGFACCVEVEQSCGKVFSIWRDMYNRVKHNNQIIASIFAEYENYIIKGFYIQGVFDDGSIGPDPTFHDTHFLVGGGISVNRLLLLAIYSLYYISDKMKIIVNKHLKSQYNLSLNYKPIYTEEEKLVSTFQKLSEMEYHFFISEYRKKYPKVSKKQNIYRLSFPHSDNLLNSKKYRITMSLPGDGVSNKFNFPGNL